TASTDLISRIVPDGARGEAMGWHGSSLTVGLAIGSPLAGWAIDLGSPSWGFAAVGLVGALAAAALLVVHRRETPPAAPSPAPVPSPAAAPAAAAPPAAP